MDPQQQFCLKWNSFGNNLVATFENLFKSSSLTDVTLFCEGVTFQAHRLILAACSKHFQDLFESAPISPSILVILDGTSSSNMSSLLEFMYKGEVHVAQESLSSFLKAAEYLQVKGLSRDTEKLITQSTSHSSSSLESKIDSPNSRQCSKSSNKLSSQPNVINKAAEDGIGGGSVGKRSPVIAEPEHSLASSTSLPYPSSPFHVQQHFKSSYDHRVPPSVPPTPAYDMIPRKRPHKSPSDTIKDNAQRASVLRDGSKPERDSPVSSVFAAMPSSLPPPSQPSSGSHHYESHTLNLQSSSMLSSDGGGTPGSLNQTAAVEDSPSPQAWGAPNCAEDLRVKCEPPESGGSSTVDENSAERKFYSSGGGGGRGNLDCGQRDRELNDRVPPLVSSPSGSGKKLPCPYCERLYGYETNLRAHIRQRHHGIRVPCPYCSRTFTRNNTVRRHIAREHTNETDLKPTTAGQTQLQSAHNNQQQ